jgi:uncharacterized protein YyaL (SSP411 family)
MNITKSLKQKFWTIFPIEKEAKRETHRDKSGIELKSYPDEKHLKETVNWLNRAQKAMNNHAVSRAYSASSKSSVGYLGWQPSYPETTGYIIPTMIALSHFFSDPSYVERSMRMADWEIDIQLPSGAVMGSVVTAPPSPAVFNTGQVIFGWLAAFINSGDQKYLNAALRAGDYLASIQEDNGSWIKDNSRYALNKATTYNTRVAWALIELGLETNENKYIDAGNRNIELALTRQLDNGWFSDNCLTDPEKPLLHTIVYAARGILESGISLNEPKYLDAAIKTLDALLDCQRPDGGLSGRLSSDWSPMAGWDCLTGDAQVAVAWLRAHAITGNRKYKDAARKAIEFIKRSQNLEHPNPGIRGGVKGSFPFDGPYGQYEMLNWAAKFFCDALMMINDEELAKKGIKG